MANQPNMQRRDDKIASLDVDELDLQDETLEETDDGVQPVADVAIDSSNRDTLYAEILEQLKRGVPQTTIETQLVSKGISRTQARELTKQVYTENSDERKFNAYVLYGTAALLGAIGLLFLLLSIRGGNIVSPAWFLIVLAGYFGWRGYRDYQSIS